MFRSKPNPGRKGTKKDGVSILVLVDVSLEELFSNPDTHFNTFQSLFSWMFRSKVAFPLVAEIQYPVSILVLVDVSLEGAAMVLFLIGGTGFNPCSRGCFARRPLMGVSPRSMLKFQSLFSWMFRSKPDDNLSSQ